MPHLFISECDGALYDTRKPNWAANPLRPNYSHHHRKMDSLADVKATIRAGQFAFPGGYQLFFVADDGGAICFQCARKEFRQIAWSWLNKCRDGWRVQACDVNYDDTDLSCANCNQSIPSAY